MALREVHTLNEGNWKSYFNSIGIPDPYAGKYANVFHKHQIPQSLLKMISDDELRDTFEVELVGHRLLIRHSQSNTAPAASTTVSAPQTNRALVRHHSPSTTTATSNGTQLIQGFRLTLERV